MTFSEGFSKHVATVFNMQCNSVVLHVAEIFAHVSPPELAAEDYLVVWEIQ